LQFVEKNTGFARFCYQAQLFLSILVTQTFFLYLLIGSAFASQKKEA